MLSPRKTFSVLYGLVLMVDFKDNGVLLQDSGTCTADPALPFVGYKLNNDVLASTCKTGKEECFLHCIANNLCRSFAVVQDEYCSALCLFYANATINVGYLMKDDSAVYYFMESRSCCPSACLMGGICERRTCTCQCPKGVTKCACPNETQNVVPASWNKVPGDIPVAQIDNGDETWAVSPDGRIFILANSGWDLITGHLTRVTCGEAGVWGVNRHDNVFLRSGVTKANPHGTLWTQIEGYLRHIDSGNNGIVYGINEAYMLYCRVGVTESRPTGHGWRNIRGSIWKYVSCGLYGCWAIRLDNSITFRTGITTALCAGLAWKDVEGSLVQLETGLTGEVYGIDEDGRLYTREGVCELNPTGERWKHIKLGITLKHITVGQSKLFGIASNGTVFVTP